MTFHLEDVAYIKLIEFELNFYRLAIFFHHSFVEFLCRLLVVLMYTFTQHIYY